MLKRKSRRALHACAQSTSWRRAAVALLGALPLTLLVAGCGQGNGQATTGPVPTFSIQSPPAASPQPQYSAPTTAAQALADLERMPVIATSTAPPYQASFFGSPKTALGSSCDLRDYVLKRDLKQVTLTTGSTCKVVGGVLFDPYTAQWRWYSRIVTLNQVDVDHVVALGDAWASGAYNWPTRVLAAFAADPINLHAAAATVIPLKGEKNAAAWLPPDVAYRCQYVINQITVKVKYLLAVTPAERDAMTAALNACPANVAGPSPTTSPPPSPSLPPKPKHGAKPKPSATPTK